jgi:putative ATP-dependent endonuclease of OLD family
MQVTRLRIRNFRSIKDLSLELEPSTVFIGANNAGKSAIIDAVRVALMRRWGRRGTGFTEHDIYAASPGLNAKTLDPVIIDLIFEERDGESWPDDLVSDLNAVVVTNDEMRNMIWLRVTCGWNEEEEAFTPIWQFLNSAGESLTTGAARANNLNSFFRYPHFFWLGELRDAGEEFAPRAAHWGTLMRAIRIPKGIEEEVRTDLDAVDGKVLAADPKFGEIASTIGESTSLTRGATPGDAKLRMLPFDMWDMISRASVIVQTETTRPWLPLGQHGQGLRSLAVIYLFQAAMRQRLLDDALAGAEPILGVEEPEAHLHPQAARTLWRRLNMLAGQKLITSHSPQFIQNVPLHAIRMVHLRDASFVSRLPRAVDSTLPWTDRVQQAFPNPNGSVRRSARGTVEATTWISANVADRLSKCWGGEPEEAERAAAVAALRHQARVMVSKDEEAELAIQGRRVRGEIFFARRWALVEGHCEYLLLHAIGEGLGYQLDEHGVAVIDFQNCGSPGVYVSLAGAFAIDWQMVVDGDTGGQNATKNISSRGFNDAEIAQRVRSLSSPNDLEAQLVADGHAALLRDVLVENGDAKAAGYDEAKLLTSLRSDKIGYITALSLRVAKDSDLAQKMPAPLVGMIEAWKAAA